MRKFFVISMMLLLSTCSGADKKIALSDLKDHIMGGWVGKGIGVTFGDIYEFKSMAKIQEGDLEPWTPERLERSLYEDDLYVAMTYVAALEAYGPEITNTQAGCVFGASLYPLAHANACGRNNIRKGIMPPDSGHPKYNPHADDIDFQIECDGLGMVSPGLPQASNALCDIFGHITNYGDGVYAGMWIAAMYTQAFFEKDVEKIAREALKAVPTESKFASCIGDVLEWHKRFPDDWRKTWHEVEKKYQDDIDCRPNRPMNIDARLNAAYVAIALLYGGGDMGKTMEIAVRCGQDSDCNSASACGVLGCSIGLAGIDEKYKSHLPKISKRIFLYTSYTYDSIGDSCVSVAQKIIEKADGKIVEENGTKYAIIPDQAPAPPITLEQWPDRAQKIQFGIR